MPSIRPPARRPAALAALALLLAAAALPAAAQSLRCNGRLLGPGDSKLSVVTACGEPAWREPVCVSRELFVWPVPALPGQVAVPLIAPACVPMEEWTYHRGEGQFLAIVRFRNAAVESVRDGERVR